MNIIVDYRGFWSYHVTTLTGKDNILLMKGAD